MAISTPWGYDVQELPPILEVGQLRTLMPALSSTDETLEAVLANVSAAVRDWCGWHVSPSLDCTLVGNG